VEDLALFDVMNHPWEIDRSVWVRQFEYEEYKVMSRTTFKTAFGGTVPDAETIRTAPVFTGHDGLEDLLQDMDTVGYDRIIITATKMWSYHYHHKLILDFSIDEVGEAVEAGGGRILGAASYNPFRISESLREIERGVTQYGFRYVWFHPLSFGLPPNDRRFYPLYAKCDELDIAVGLQVGHSAEPLPSDVGRPMLVDDVAIEFPNLRINLSHTGWPWVAEWCSMLWRHPNVYGDISAYMPHSLDSELVRFMDSARGRDKVLFGTNGLGLRRCKQEFLELDISDDTKRMVGRENVVRFLKLES
jgi:predicted TIM-barrel fold metal-dependent hydrolase